MNTVLLYFAIKYDGNWDKVYKALDKKEKATFEELEEVEKRAKNEGWNYITIIDDEYPEQLKQAYKPPFVIWYKGDKDVFDNKFICTTGNQVDKLSKTRIESFIPEVEKRNKIINMSYVGVDKEIISISKKPILRVEACGLNKVDCIAEKDLFISEFPMNSVVDKEKMRNRNRLVAAFAESLVLFTSKKNGPINNLITNFLNLGKEVYCFSGNGSSLDGNSDLIKQGATYITSIKDIE